jgi:hypothetical protein
MFGLGNGKFKIAIDHGLAEGNLDATLGQLGDFKIESIVDAKTLCRGLERLNRDESRPRFVEEVTVLVGLFQDVPNDRLDIARYLQQHGLPHLAPLFDQMNVVDGHSATHCALLIFKMFALYQWQPGIDRMIEAARMPFNADDYMWKVILQSFSRKHPFRDYVYDALADPLPPGFIAVSLLDSANITLLAGETIKHPFDTPQGVNRLRELLRNPDPKYYSYGHSASTALPFISEPARSELLELAMDHPDIVVSMAAAWAAAKIGQGRGLACLARYAANLNTSRRACQYLTDLKRSDAIPTAAKEPNFAAMAEMVHWLTHPNEFGEPPNDIELYDTRELFWPPTEDRRQVWLFKYRYLPGGRRKKEDVNLGMVGGVTMSLFGESLPTADPVDAYALHCCWELQVRENPRAPKERTVELGRKILAEHNPAL